MAPTQGGPCTHTDLTPSHAPARYQPLAPLGALDDTDDPDILLDLYAARLEEAADAARADRGKVHKPSDTFDLIRQLHDVRANFERALKFAATMLDRVDAQLAQEMRLAHGRDDDGNPKKNMRVPLETGETLHLEREFITSYDVGDAELSQFALAMAELMAMHWRSEGDKPQLMRNLTQYGADVAVAMVRDVMRKTDVKSTGVRALAESLSQRGQDKLADVVTDVLGEPVKTFRKIKVTSKTPIQEAAAPPVGARRRPRAISS
jgi:hypothetical protein